MRQDKDKILIRQIWSLQESAFMQTNKQCKDKPEVCVGLNHRATVCVLSWEQQLLHEDRDQVCFVLHMIIGLNKYLLNK